MGNWREEEEMTKGLGLGFGITRSGRKGNSIHVPGEDFKFEWRSVCL